MAVVNVMIFRMSLLVTKVIHHQQKADCIRDCIFGFNSIAILGAKEDLRKISDRLTSPIWAVSALPAWPKQPGGGERVVRAGK
jgi:hypothetical protein